LANGGRQHGQSARKKGATAADVHRAIAQIKEPGRCWPERAKRHPKCHRNSLKIADFEAGNQESRINASTPVFSWLPGFLVSWFPALP
jgi:hypothetical protein